jgi:hypothetical protein
MRSISSRTGRRGDEMNQIPKKVDTMKQKAATAAGAPGVTLIELTVVIFVIISIMGATMYFSGNIGEWNKGKRAALDTID